MLKNSLGFKTSLISTVVISLLLSLSAMTYLAYQIIKEKVEDKLIDDIRYTLTVESNEILALFKRAEDVVSEAATILEKSANTNEYPNILAISASTGGIHKLTLGFQDGSSYSSKSSKSFPGGVGIKSKYDPRIRPWYQDAKTKPGLSHSAPFFNKQGMPMLSVAHTVGDGVLSADVRFSHLKEKLVLLVENEGMPSFIMNKSGLILASTIEQAPAKENVFKSSLQYMIQDLIKGDMHVIEYEIDGVIKLFLAETIELLNGEQWFFVLSIDKNTAYAPVKSATQKLIGILFITAIISTLFLLLVLKVIYKPILSLRTLITDLSQGDGDLTQRLEVKNSDDISQIAMGVNKFIEQLQLMMKEVQKATVQLSERVERIHEQSESNTNILSRHAAETEQIVTAVEELSSSALMVSDNSKVAASSATDANSSSDDANNSILEAQTQIAELANEIVQASNNVKQMDSATNDIQSIVEVIGSIAEQTNLLALNASIEAARAGEKGRGFAVVADEVRALANRTQVSTTEIGNAIASLQKEASNVVNAITETQTTCQTTVEQAESVSNILHVLNDHITLINNMNAEISSSSQEQSKVITTISENVTQLHDMVAMLASNSDEQHQEVGYISDINKNLTHIINKFKL